MKKRIVTFICFTEQNKLNNLFIVQKNIKGGNASTCMVVLRSGPSRCGALGHGLFGLCVNPSLGMHAPEDRDPYSRSGQPFAQHTPIFSSLIQPTDASYDRLSRNGVISHR